MRGRAPPGSSADTADIVTNPEAFKRFQEAQAQLTGALGGCWRYGRYPDLNQSFSRCNPARGYGESHCSGTARLHRGGAPPQYGAAHIPACSGLDDLSQR